MTSPLNVLIVDDEAPARNRLRELLSDIAPKLPVNVAGEAENGVQALEALANQPADVVLLDIRMPGMGGIELAQHLQRMPSPPAIIFTTAYDNYAIQAFDVNAIDYLLKPIRAERLLKALQKTEALTGTRLEALKTIEKEPRSSLSVAERGKVLLIPVSDILYLRAEQKYVTARTLEREYLLDESLMKLEEEFGERFVRIHRSCLVARDFIEGFEKGTQEGEEENAPSGWSVILKGLSERLPVSRRQQGLIKSFRKS